MIYTRIKHFLVAPCLLFLFYLPLSHADQTKRQPLYTEEGTPSCLVCHSGERITAIRTGVHGENNPMFQRGCEDCHGPGSFHVSRAHGGRGFPSMIVFGKGKDTSPRDDQVDACLVCHAEPVGSKDSIVFLDSVHDKPFINCSSCHSVHTEIDLAKDKEQQAAGCYACHTKTKAEHPRFEDKSINFDSLTCATCHDPHKTVLETQ